MFDLTNDVKLVKIVSFELPQRASADLAWKRRYPQAHNLPFSSPKLDTLHKVFDGHIRTESSAKLYCSSSTRKHLALAPLPMLFPR
jgi:hypothetical protein